MFGKRGWRSTYSLDSFGRVKPLVWFQWSGHYPDDTFEGTVKQVRLEATTTNNVVTYEKVFVSVKDTGIGIPRESIKKIWDRFYKSDLSRGKDKKGTGLGLAIVKEIVQAHGENIDVISTQGVGSEFIFTLPKATAL